MEPKLPEVNSLPEQVPGAHDQYLEQSPVSLSPEIGIEGGVERFEQRSEATPAAANSMPILPPLQTVAAPVSEPIADAATLAVDDNPIAASDDDLIEKEWVDKAKKIIMQTKDDPFRREQEVSRLQADYLRKRYGKELGSSQ